MIDVDWSYCPHFAVYADNNHYVVHLQKIPAVYILLYVNYTSIKKKNQLVVSISMAAKLFWVLTFILVKSMAQINFSPFEFRFFL